MRTRQQIPFVIFVTCIIMYSCSQKTGSTADAEQPKIKSTVDNFKKFWETKDTSVLSRIIAHDADMVNYGTDANEIFVGWNALRDSVQKLLPMIDKVKINVRNQVIKIGPSSDCCMVCRNMGLGFCIWWTTCKTAKSTAYRCFRKTKWRLDNCSVSYSVPVTQ